MLCFLEGSHLVDLHFNHANCCLFISKLSLKFSVTVKHVGMELSEAVEMMMKIQNDNNVKAAKLKGTHKDCCTKIIKHHKKLSRVLLSNENDENILVIDSYDKKKGQKSIASFSSQITSTNLLKENKVQAGSSLNILT